MSSDRVSVHFTGRSERQRGRRGDEVLDVARRLRAEAAADPRAHDAQLARARARASARYAPWIACGAWCETQQREAAVAVGHGDDAVGLHRHAGEPLADHRDLGDDVGALERVDVLAERRCRSRRSTRARGTAAVRRRRAPSVGGDDRGQRVVVDDRRLRRRRRPAHLVSATTAATMSPTKRTLSVAKTGRFSVGRHHREALERRQAEVVAVGVVHGDHAGHRLPPRLMSTDDDVGVGDRRAHEARRAACPARRGRRRTCPRR